MSKDTNSQAAKSTIETAIFPVAGVGTRMLPATSTIDKTLMPVYGPDGAFPVIHYTTMDAVKAGVKRLVIVTSERGEEQIRGYFGPLNDNLKATLERLGKTGILSAEIARRAEIPELEYIIQEGEKYGTAIPLAQAYPAIRGEKHIAYLGGDDFVHHRDGTSEARLALDTWAKQDTDHLIMGSPVPREDAGRYGILQTRPDDGTLFLIDEKPPTERIPAQPVANIGRYFFDMAEFYPVLAEFVNKPRYTEYYLTDVINVAVGLGDTACVHTIEGQYLDCGTPQSILEASKYMFEHPNTPPQPKPKNEPK